MFTIDIRKELSDYGKKIVNSGLVAGAGGNISAREEDIVWMKPSGLAMDEVMPEDWVGINIKTGLQVHGTLKPTSEVNMHLEIYRVRPEIKAVFHTHSPWVCGVISSGAEFRPMFAEFVCDLGKIDRIPYITPTTKTLAEIVAKKMSQCDTLFMENHGIVTIGMTIKQAFYRCAVVEDAAKSLVAASVVGKPIFLTQKQIDELMQLEGPQHRIKMMEGKYEKEKK